MSNKPENPPAFPNPALANEAFSAPFNMDGMTLRDYFAGQALVGLCQNFNGAKMDVAWFEQVGANGAYGISDAMLNERAK